jgi:hypothetical protein
LEQESAAIYALAATSRLMRVIIVITISALLFSCASPLEKQNLETWFYDLPVHADVSLIRAKLNADIRFHQQKSTDTTKQWYQYQGVVQQPYVPSGIPMPDSVVIEFSHFDFDTTAHNPEDRINMTVVKLFQVDYFYNKSEDLDNLFEAAYDDLKVPFVKGHDITIEHDGKEVATGRNITYKTSKDFSQDIEVVKRMHRNGSTSVRLVLKMGEK